MSGAGGGTTTTAINVQRKSGDCGGGGGEVRKEVGECVGVAGWTLTGLRLTAYGKQSQRITINDAEGRRTKKTTLNGAACCTVGTVTIRVQIQIRFKIVHRYEHK